MLVVSLLMIYRLMSHFLFKKFFYSIKIYFFAIIKDLWIYLNYTHKRH